MLKVNLQPKSETILRWILLGKILLKKTRRDRKVLIFWGISKITWYQKTLLRNLGAIFPTIMRFPIRIIATLTLNRLKTLTFSTNPIRAKETSIVRLIENWVALKTWKAVKISFRIRIWLRKCSILVLGIYLSLRCLTNNFLRQRIVQLIFVFFIKIRPILESTRSFVIYW